MNFDSSTILAGLVVSSAGFVLFRYGKSLDRVPHLATGLVLMAFPYFVGSAMAALCIGAGLLAALWIGVRLGL